MDEVERLAVVVDLAVGIVEGVEELEDDVDGLGAAHHTAVTDEVALQLEEVAPGDELHDEVEEIALLPEFEDVADVGVM